MSDGSKDRLRVKGKSRRRELQSAIVEWRLRGMSKAQARSMAELFDTTANAPPLTDEQFVEVFKDCLLYTSDAADE